MTTIEEANLEETVLAPIPSSASEMKHEDPDMRWYILRSQSQEERKVRNLLQSRARNMDMGDCVGRVFVPEYEQIAFRRGGRKNVAKVTYPGYVLVEMKMTDETWFMARNTPGVTGFVSAYNVKEKRDRPIPVSPAEAFHMLDAGAKKVEKRASVDVGDMAEANDEEDGEIIGRVRSIDYEREIAVLSFIREVNGEMEEGEFALTSLRKL